MSTDGRILWKGAFYHAAAALLGVIAAAGFVHPGLFFASGLIVLGILAAGSVAAGFFIGVVSGGWAWILVGGRPGIRCLWTWLSTLVTFLGTARWIAHTLGAILAA